MRLAVCSLSVAALFAACIEHNSTAPALDQRCWTMSVDGAEPMSAVIRTTGALFGQDTAISPRKAFPSPRTEEPALTGTWRYAYYAPDSIYVRLGDNTRGYYMWLFRTDSTSRTPQSYAGNVRVRKADGHAWTTSARLTRTNCR